MRKSLFLLATLLLLLGLAVVRETRQQPAAQIEAKFLDWLAATSEPHPESNSPGLELTLVEINDNSLQAPHIWPWSPLDYALFLQASLNLKPAVVAIEEVLNWGELSGGSPADQAQRAQHEKSLHDLLLKTPKALLGGRLGLLEDPDLIPALQSIPLVRNVKGDRSQIPEYSLISAEPKQVFRLSPELGFTNLPEGPVVRSIPLIFRYRGEIVPSFALQALMLWLKLTPDEIEVQLGNRIRLGNEREVPIDASGSMLINFQSKFNRISYDDLLLATAPGRTPPAFSTEGGLFQLSRTDEASQNYLLPEGTAASAGELFAYAISTAASGQFIHKTPFFGELAIILLCILIGRWAMKLERLSAWMLCVLLFTLYLFLALTLFSNSLLVLPLLLPLTLLIFIALFRSCFGTLN